MPKIAKPLTAIEVKRLIAPGYHAAGTVPGLTMQVTPGGARSWVLRVRTPQGRQEIGLGAYPAIGLAEAHEKARQARERVSQGVDIIRERKKAQMAAKAAAQVNPFEAVAAAYIDHRTPEWRDGGKSRAQWEASLRTYAYPKIGKRVVNELLTTDILETLKPIWLEKPETATRVRSRIEAVLDYATAMQMRDGPNPARWKGNLKELLQDPSEIKKVRHHPALPFKDAPAFFQALGDYTSHRCLAFAILTAARSSEARGARWEEFTDLSASNPVWEIPGDRMKMARAHRVPLSVQAVELLNALPGPRTGLVFPAAKGGELSDGALLQIMRKRELPYVPHGFRSTFMDWAHETTKTPAEVLDMCLAHVVENKVEAAYRRGDLLDKRRPVMNMWGEYLINRT